MAIIPPKRNHPYNRYDRRSSGTPQTRINERIRAEEVRCIDADGAQVGILSTKQAIELAKKRGLDLVEISPTARPPVCRILDYGKYKYEQSKKSKDSKQTATKVKEVKFRLVTGQHDYMTKLRKAEQFMNLGNKVKFTLMLRGREMQQSAMALERMAKVAPDLAHIGIPDHEPRAQGRFVMMTMSPLPANKRKLIYSQGDEEFEDDSDEDMMDGED